MAKIGVVTDSTSSLSPEMAQQYDIRMVPLRINIGNESFRDGVDISSSQYLERLTHAKELPKTSQPAVGDFAQTFEEMGAQYDSIIVPLLSTKLSGTVSSALTAAGMYPQYKITVIDSLSTFMGLGFMAIRAAEAAAAGQSHEQIVAMVEGLVGKMQVLLVVDTLEYLHKGGRIGGAQAFLGGMLNVKPMLQLKDGGLERLQQIRTKRKANEKLVELIVERCAGRPAHISLGYAGNQPEIAAIASDLKPKVQLAELVEFEVGPVISTHTGPGVVGTAFYVE